MVNHPARMAIRPEGPIHKVRYKKGRDWYRVPRLRSHKLHKPVRIISMPRPTMTRNDQKTMVELGRSSLGNSLSAGTCLSRLWVRMMLPR
ncbi:hypothetical protein D3C76_1358210 [compost metagenome]